MAPRGHGAPAALALALAHRRPLLVQTAPSREASDHLSAAAAPVRKLVAGRADRLHARTWPELPPAVLLIDTNVTEASNGRMTCPTLSVVVVCINDARVREKCLAALAPQTASGDLEVLAVGHDDGPAGRAMRSCYPDVVWLSTPSDYTVPRMRISAMNRSRGKIVA